VRLLLLGGGGCGGKGSGNEVGGGGGAGGYLEGITNKLMSSVKYKVTIGAGGDATGVREAIEVTAIDANDVMLSEEPVTYVVRKGGDTSITDPSGLLLANAGGGGRGIANTSSSDRSGASTGGAGLYQGPNVKDLSSTRFDPSLEATGGGGMSSPSILALGNSGGTAVPAASNAGGGGGAQEPGGNATTGRGGKGGNGQLSNITGTDEYYAGGGGGGTDNYANGSGGPSRGGSGGGGAGAWWSTTVPAIAGTDYLGGGGGGGVGGAGTNSLTQAGAPGGNGAVYIKTEADLAYSGDYEAVNTAPGSKAYVLKTSGDLSFGSPPRPKFTHSSLYCPSTTSGISALGNNGLLELGGDWSIDFWLRLTKSPGTEMIFDARGSTSQPYPTLYFEGDSLRLTIGLGMKLNLGSIWSSYGDSWVHVALVNISTRMASYLNGVQTRTSVGATYGAGAAAFLGSAIANLPLKNAYLQDFRLCSNVPSGELIANPNETTMEVPLGRATATPGCKILMFTGDDDYSTFWTNKAPGGGKISALSNATSSEEDATDPSNRILIIKPDEEYPTNNSNDTQTDNDVDFTL
jgi:hypothetical protein